jgi:putative ABC transport system permease protein
VSFFETLVQDLRYGLRLLRRNPVFTTGSVLALALGIGANTAIFSFTNAILLRPFPVHDTASLVSLYHTNTRNPGSFSPTSYLEYLDYKEHSEIFAGLTAYARIPVNLSGGSVTRTGSAELVTANYFKVLGLDPVLGRAFLPEEDKDPGAHPVAVISYALWQSGFGADPDLRGKTVSLSGCAFQVIGVVPRGFAGMALDWGEQPDVWVPLSMYAQANPALAGTDLLNHRDMPWLLVVGRLKDYLAIEQAQAATGVLARHSDQSPADEVATRRVILLPIQKARFWPGFREAIVRFLMLLQCSVACVLLIACANVANLMLERASVRRQEMAVRLALGAPRGRVVRLFLTEGLLIAALGMAAGLVVAIFAQSLLMRFGLPFRIHLNVEVGFDWRVLGFALALSLFTVLLFGLVPALRASRAVITAAGNHGTAGRGIAGRSPLTSLLVVLQVAFSLVILVAAGLFARTLINAKSADPGFSSRNLILFTVDPATQGSRNARIISFYEQVLERVISLPGVRSATWARDIPLDISRMETKVRPAETGAATTWTQTEYNVVGAGYFRIMGISLLRGRDFTHQDLENSLRVVIVNETLARRNWPAGNALAQRIEIKDAPGQVLEVVGIAGDLKYHELGEISRPYFYLPLLQQRGMPMMTLHVDPAGSAASVIAAVLQQIRVLDRGLPVFVQSLDEHMNDALSQPRMASSLIGWAGILAATLAAVGIYAVLAYSVSLRSREIGVRMAIGATPTDVLWMVLKEGMALVAAGLGSGLLAALGSARLIASYLYGIPPTDIATFSGVALLLAAVAFLACLVPARRASHSDPAKTLHYE